MSTIRPSEYTHYPAWWVRGGHAQTLWSVFFRARPTIAAALERWDTPDGDFIELYRLRPSSPDAPRLLLLHGLEGGIRSHYVGGFFTEAARRGWGADLLLFRGCGSEPNRAPRFYHSGDTADLSFALDRIAAEFPSARVVMAGVSLGGNVLLKYLGERGTGAPSGVAAAAAISVPFDLERGARFLSTGASRLYDRHFLRSLRQKALAKLDRFPSLFDRARLDQARSLYEFDDAVTAPVHGFADAHDYYSRSSALRWIAGIARPTLLFNAVDDPFLPPAVLDEVREIGRENSWLELDFLDHGGHVGFIGGRLPWSPVYHAERRACDFLASWLDRGQAGPDRQG